MAEATKEEQLRPNEIKLLLSIFGDGDVRHDGKMHASDWEMWSRVKCKYSGHVFDRSAILRSQNGAETTIVCMRCDMRLSGRFSGGGF